MADRPAKKKKIATARKRIPNVVRRSKSREAVLLAAEELFVRQGYRSTTVDQISAAAGLTKGAIYFHFEDKASVLLALIERAETRIILPLLEKLNGDGDPGDKIIEYLHYWARIALEQRETMFLPILMSLEFVSTGEKIEQRLQQMYERVYQALTAIVKEGQQSGRIRDATSPRAYAAILIAMSDGMLLEWLRRNEKINGLAVVRGFRGMLLSGLIDPQPPKSRR